MMSFEWHWINISLVRLTLATILGGLIGWERAHINRPAGVRTHEVVCIGSTLCMLVSEYINQEYGNIDPTRIGAQVISGIGFLGAGTIIKEGFSVKGLTTAASLWCVSCIGLALGTGFYSGAVIATLFIFCTLIMMKKLMINYSSTKTICLLVEHVDPVHDRALELFNKFNCTVHGTQIIMNPDKTKEIQFIISISSISADSFEYLAAKLRHMEGVLGQQIE